MVGIPASGKTTLSRLLAEHYSLPYLHSSQIIKEACPGDWIEKGHMAPEPCATFAIEQALMTHAEWILDGFPRSARQIGSINHEPIVYLDISNPQALRRAIKRGAASPEVEEYRIREQSRILSPIRQIAAVFVPTWGKTPEQTLQTVLDWYEHDIHPTGSGRDA